ncbi:phosphatase PAP2 family protein [Orbus sturtevantii]|uniref:phosphatase PAP2 family protein n=1 Tax=Orbus sturtevantii TaxID=3074109 RepID=UPI00370D33B1
MLSVIKKTCITLIIFLIVPAFLISIDWQWQPSSLNVSSKYLFWFTEMAGMPWAMLICLILPIVFAICLKVRSISKFITLVIILAISILLGQTIKSIVKDYTAESRPFVLWIEKSYQVDDEYFYSLPRSERKQIIRQYVHHSPQIPNWLYRHWRAETGYTFPSGHTIFAATWAFLALLFLRFKRHFVIVGLVITWTVLIEISRLALGMHHPIDVISGSILAWLIALIAYYFAIKWQLLKQ